MTNSVCENCPAGMGCCLDYGGKACEHYRKEAGYTAKETNYDRIRAMRVEEMVVWLDDLTCNCQSDDCEHCKIGCTADVKPCRPKTIYEWLETEVD